MNYKFNLDSFIDKVNKTKAQTCLVTENPSENTIKLYNYLKSIQGKGILSGQQYLYEDEAEDSVYYHTTGKIPAVRGYDFMGISGLGYGYNQLDRAYRWCSESGGILTMCWHWYAPDNMDEPRGKAAFYTEHTSFDLLKAVEYGTAEYEFVVNEIDLVAKALKRFQDADFPILWRPLHEANGNWFWWGGLRTPKHKDAYLKLWYMIFDRFQYVHKLNNLIWVWTGQDINLLPHENTFDMAGEDIYPTEKDYSSQSQSYQKLSRWVGEKLIALTENGYVPDPDLLIEDKAKWLHWLPWWGSFVYKPLPNHKPELDEDGLPIANEERFPAEYMKKVFSHPYVISLQDLPWWNSEKYRLPRELDKWIAIGKNTIKLP